MYPVSPAFLDSLRVAHRPWCQVDIYERGLPIETDIPISTGTITMAYESDVRATVDLTLPQAYSTKIDPYQTDLRVKMGIEFPNGTYEVIPMGVFRCFQAGLTRPGATVKITGADWGELVSASEFVRPWTVPGNVRVTDAITSILADSYDHLTVENRATSTDDTTHRAIYDGSRWDAINELADSIDAVVYMDREGVMVIADDVAGDPVWEVDTGQRGVLSEYSVALSREGQGNIVVCRGDNPNGQKAWAKAEDNDPYSPTRVDGWYGKRVLTFESQAWTTREKCRRAATKKLARYSGLAQTVDLSAVPNPALDPGDVISLRFYSGQREVHQISGITIDLGPGGPMKLATRLKRVYEGT